MARSDARLRRTAGPVGRPRRRGWVRWVTYRLLAVLVGLVAVVGGIEGALRLLPGLFASDALSWAFSRYDTLPGGMYVKERQTKMRFMRADYSTRAYSHGYFWRHQTDSLGFRNPSDLVDHGVLLLGDSFIYGHVVEEDETFSNFLMT